MDVESSLSNGFVMLDYKDALLRWSKSWAELAENSLNHDVEPHKMEEIDSDAGYASEGSCRRFYLGSKNGSVGSLDECALEEEEEGFGRDSDGVSDYADDREDADDASDDVPEDADEGFGLDVNIEMIGSECVLVNGYKEDDLPCPTEATRDGMTPDVILEYNHEDLIDLACRYISHIAGRNEQYIRPKICWAMVYAPDFDEEQDS